ncbi:MAG: hypothetical protein H6565_16940 [Lewinellaceae bacterium]|nr:hypothetical protein [Lewinellaceae bacterium]
MHKPSFLSILLSFALICAVASCSGTEAPLDAETRQTIDSLSGVGMRNVKAELDSMCVLERKRSLPHLVDSFRILRTKEIERQLKTIPK